MVVVGDSMAQPSDSVTMVVEDGLGVKTVSAGVEIRAPWSHQPGRRPGHLTCVRATPAEDERRRISFDPALCICGAVDGTQTSADQLSTLS